MVADRLRPVQVTEGGIPDAVEDVGWDDAHPADRDLALGLTRRAAGDEGVGHDHRGQPALSRNTGA